MSDAPKTRPVIRIPDQDKVCACRGFDVAALVEVAHVPNWRTSPDKFLPLCLLCHRAYDIGLTTEAEMTAIMEAWRNGSGPMHSPTAIQALWALRSPDLKKLQQGAGERAGRTRMRRTATKKAVATRRNNKRPVA